jgi:predicted nucleic acid-binding protein
LVNAVIAFFDANALIYLIEAKAPFADKVRKTLSELARKYPDIRSAVSRLTWLECRVGPMKNNDNDTLAIYDAFFSRADIQWIELTRDVVELAAARRVKHGLRTPDALQAACCLQLGANHIFLSGDKTFERVAGLNVKMLS